MDLLNWLNQAKDLGSAALSQATGLVGAGVGYARESLGQTWLLGSTETSASYDHGQVDEKHYFLVPDRRSELWYSLYTMRCLPEGAPPVNDLPKRRVFHLPHENALPTLEQILLEGAREEVAAAPSSGLSVGGRLNDLADQIDRLDQQVFGGVLLIGGLVALINPLAGAAVAAKALIPSLGMLLSKHGLKYAGDAASSREAAARIRAAEKEVLNQFHESGASSLLNPVLAQLDRALSTSAYEFDPAAEFASESLSFGDRDQQRMLRLTSQAITNTYEGLIDDRRAWQAACLGEEDIRFLEKLRKIAIGLDEPTD